MAESILITGGSGRIGTFLRTRLRRSDRVIRLLDIRPHQDLGPSDLGQDLEFVRGSITDPIAMNDAAAGMDAIIHLGGIPNSRAAWHDINHLNIVGTTTVFEAARQQNVPRMVFASSNHAVGHGEHHEPLGSLPRADSFYGVSKIFGEALGSLYHDHDGMHVVCIRIGSCFDRPRTTRMLRTWISPDDTGRVFEAALSHPEPNFTIVWGVSDNQERTWPLDSAIALGYQPRDDASRYVAEHGCELEQDE